MEMPVAHWSAAFIGLPFHGQGRDRSGLDCWGLVRLVFEEVHGVALPSYTERYASVAERREIAAIMHEASGGADWRAVTDEQEFDVAMFRAMGEPLHVGLVVRKGLMLHVSSGIESRIESYRDGRWRPRLLGFYRHTSQCR
jgi:cell wall-associated NlpC family hydrolase